MAEHGDDIELPVPSNEDGGLWGSDAIALTLRQLGVDYIAMVPGSSYRGLQDSLVNFLGNRDPRMIVTLHEEHAVAIAHGYAKVAEKPMAAGLHSNVGLMHATMAIYNAWCDRAPVLMLGATGPVDAVRRRPWIDWIHTSRDQGALVRPYVKWDEQPASPAAGVEAVLRAWSLITTAPKGPAYICLDVSDQERAIDEAVLPAAAADFVAPPQVAPPADAIARAAEALRAAEKPLILAGRVSRSVGGWRRRVALAETLGARVVTDFKTAAAFPTAHPLHVGGAGQFLSPAQKAALAEADAVLALDWIDLAGTLAQAAKDDGGRPCVIHVTTDDQLTNGWSYDHFGLAKVDLRLACDCEQVVDRLCDTLGAAAPAQRAAAPAAAVEAPGDRIDLRALAVALDAAARGRSVTYTRFPLGWPADATPFEHPLDFLGGDGGAGIGSGPGLAVGAALALKGSGRLPVAVLGDGDFLMGASAIWTAAHYRLPLVVVVANNLSYFNDEIHQDVVAAARRRSQANRWIGQRLDDPAVDIPALARSFGCRAEPSVERPASLEPSLRAALERASAHGEVVVVDVRVQPGYASAMPTTAD